MYDSSREGYLNIHRPMPRGEGTKKSTEYFCTLQGINLGAVV